MLQIQRIFINSPRQFSYFTLDAMSPCIQKKPLQPHAMNLIRTSSSCNVAMVIYAVMHCICVVHTMYYNLHRVFHLQYNTFLSAQFDSLFPKMPSSAYSSTSTTVGKCLLEVLQCTTVGKCRKLYF